MRVQETGFTRGAVWGIATKRRWLFNRGAIFNRIASIRLRHKVRFVRVFSLQMFYFEVSFHQNSASSVLVTYSFFYMNNQIQLSPVQIMITRPMMQTLVQPCKGSSINGLNQSNVWMSTCQRGSHVKHLKKMHENISTSYIHSSASDDRVKPAC